MQPILTINLTTKKIEHYTVPTDWQRDYLGGSSLAAIMLYDHLTPFLDPLSPEAPLLFLTGPLTGTMGPAVGRFVICGRSPATGLWAESNCGGFWGPELRKAGFDGLWLTGRADQPVYLWLQDGQVEVRDAAHLWGLETAQTQETILNELETVRKPRVAVIGPAGESQIPYALILTDHGRVAGRTGLGAVMGSKNLKAIAVSGNNQIPVTSSYEPLRAAANRTLRDDNMSRVMRELGSASGSDYFDYLGEMPKKYFQSGVFDGADKMTGAAMAETILVGVSACHACVIACGRVVKLDDEDKRKGPEYETIVGFGPNLLIDDLPFVARMGELCDRYGMDVISLSNTLGLAFSLFEGGIIQEIDTGGLSLNWGDTCVVETLVHQTIRQEGLGVLISQGARALALHFGALEQAVQVNGLEVPFHDPRAASGMALIYATSPRGACHNQSDYFFVDLLGQVEESLGMVTFDRHAGAEKVANVVVHQNWRTVFNALVICFFANLSPDSLVDLVNASTGASYSLSDLLQIGERAWNLKRTINQRLGLTSAEDTLPQALLEPCPDGGSAGYRIPLNEMLSEYYDIRGWDAETGMPTPEKMHALRIDP
ncbi:MAG: aldehyde ferredoxin oxidoreductase family protein [Chloroflexi bacterium]|nr:aldehyde ferredoxin oxidoreductase family protein [Chloroflexota bacterium]